MTTNGASNENRPVESPRVFVTLDGLRGIAALAIALHHDPFLYRVWGTTGILHGAYLAVDFFFVLSGFVLAHAYTERLRAGLSTLRFMSIRLVRLYPLYLAALAISVVPIWNAFFAGAQSTALRFDLLFGLLFLPSPFSDFRLFPFNTSSWSLFCELAANAIFGLIGRYFLACATVAALGGLVLLLAVPQSALGFGPHSGAMDAGQDWQSIGAGLSRAAYSFFAGVVIFRLWQSRGKKIRVPPMAIVAVLAVIFIASPPAQLQVIFDLSITLVAFPALVFLGADSIPSGRQSDFFAWFGRISYALYVVQVPIYVLARRLIDPTLTKLPYGQAAIAGLVCVALVMVVASLADKYLDRPARRALVNYLFRPRTKLQSEGRAP